MKRKINILINPIIEFKNITIETYNENAPNTIGFLLYLYGPIVTNFLVCGLIEIPNPSAGPPFPILNKKTFDHIMKYTPAIKNNIENMYLNIIELINTFPDNR